MDEYLWREMVFIDYQILFLLETKSIWNCSANTMISFIFKIK